MFDDAIRDSNTHVTSCSPTNYLETAMPDSTADDTDDEIVETFVERLQEKLSSSGVQFDPMAIAALLAMLWKIFQDCRNPSPARIKRRRARVRMRFDAALDDKFPEMSRRERHELSNRVFDIAADSTDEEVERFVGACCR